MKGIWLGALLLTLAWRSEVSAKEKFEHRVHLASFAKLGMTCLDCHNFTVKTQEDLPTASGVTAGQTKVPSSLCKNCHAPPANEATHSLCLNCHREHEPTHPLKEPKYCLECHQTSTGRHRELGFGVQSQKCRHCHEGQRLAHPRTSQLLQTDRANHLIFEKGAITCQTCHWIHQPKKPRPLNFCASCHAAKAEQLYREFHRRIKK